MEELGRELNLEDLKKFKLPKVVAISREDKNFWTTVWLGAIGSKHLLFASGVSRPVTMLVAAIRPDGKFTDDSGFEILVREYTGEI